jgi:hypothetical protein
MTTSRFRRFAARRIAVACALAAGLAAPAGAQTFSQRGFIDAVGFLFPRDAPNDATNVVADLLVREEAFLKPAGWLQFAAGVDLRANSHDQVDASWGVNFTDRGVLRPAISIRRLAATISRGPLTIDAGKQFMRWGKADVVTPTDWFAPRDFINVVDNEFLGVTGVRAVVQAGVHSFDAIWVPYLTPSRTPLPDQRWTVVPQAAQGAELVDGGAEFPHGSEVGFRWSRTGAVDFSLSVFDGFNHLPNVEPLAPPPVPPPAVAAPPLVIVRRTYPGLRGYGADIAVPTKLFTIKGEAAYSTSETPMTDDYVLYVVQLERQSGEWVFVGGYAGEVVTASRSQLAFSPQRGLSKSFVGRASYTLDANRSVAFETAVKQDGQGVYVKGEYSQASGAHWRMTVTGVAIAGQPDDFLGQYNHNSHVTADLRYSF